jgi:hypothetical protein
MEVPKDGIKKHRSVICDYENTNRTDGCFAGILPESGLPSKREKLIFGKCPVIL